MKKILLLFVLPLTVSILIYLYFFFQRAPFDSSSIPKILFTPSQLSNFTGDNDSPVYLSIVGHVFDVSSGKSHYGPGGSYHFFVGKDGSRAFVTGHFDNEHLIPNISDLPADKIFDLNNWFVFYRSKYPEIGKLTGHFFDEKGEPTANYLDFELKLKGCSFEKENLQ